MATVQQIANLRLMVDEQDEEFYTDDELNDRIDAAALAGYTLNFPARDIWMEKAARYSTLVNISEGGSSRANGDLWARAKGMVELYSGFLVSETALVAGPRVVIAKLTR